MRTAKYGAWLIWFIAALFYSFEFIHRVIVSVMIPELTESFEVGSALLSSLSAAYFIAYALAQIPVGLLIDRYGTRILLTFACLAISISSLVFAYSESLTLANYCRVIIGLGSAFAFVGCLKLAANWFPAHQFAFVVGLTNLLGVIGAILGSGPAAQVIEAFGWRATMYVSGLIGLVLCILLWNIVRDTSNRLLSKLAVASKVLGDAERRSAVYTLIHEHSSTASTTQFAATVGFGKKSNRQRATKVNTSKFTASLKEVVNNKQTWLVAIFAGCMVAPIVTYSELWGVTFLSTTYKFDRPLAALISTLTFIGIAIGGPIIGWLSDYYRQRTFFMGIGMVGALITIYIILFCPIASLYLIYLLHIFFGFFTSSMLLCFTLNSEATRSKIRATTVAFTNSVIMLAGAVLQMISGYLLEFTYNNFATSFIPLIGCYAVALLCYMNIKEPPCTFTQD